jgi:adhesin/invasin
MIPLMPRPFSFVGLSVPRAAAVTLTALFLAACNGDDGPRPPSTVAAVSSSSFTGTVGDLVSDPLVVKVTDDRGAGLGGIVVTFTVAEGGGSTTPAVDTTDNTGTATTRWRLGGTAGQQRVTASIAGVATQVNFTAATTAGAPATVALQAGDNQNAVAGAAVTTPPAVLVRDRFNNPVNATSVFFSVSAGGGTVTGAGAVTNSSGVATVGSWTLGPAVGANRLTALVVANGVTANPVTFNATATAGAATAVSAQSATTLAATVGALVTPIPSIRVADANGNPVAGVNVTFAPSTGSTVVGGTKTTNLSGVAAPDGWQLGATAGTYTLSVSVGTLSPVIFTATARSGAAAAVTIVAGNNQTAIVGRTLTVDPSVRIADAFGNPIVGQEVVFEVTAGGGSAVVRRPLTDANGVATVGAWTLGESPGTNTLRATATGLTIAGNPATFTATATAGAPAAISAVAGTNQSAVAGQLVANAPSVVVRDNRGNPVSGVSVTFSIGSGGGTVTGATAVTNTAGIATVGSWRLGATAGAQSLVARLNDLPDVVFTATATPGAASQILAVSNTAVGPLTVAFAQASPLLPSVRVTDALGNPVAGVVVTFELGNNSSGVITGETQTTNASGIATLTSWTLPVTAGLASVVATIPGATGVTFVATLVAAAPATLTTVSVPTYANTGAGTLSLRVQDAFGNAVANSLVTVTFTLNATNTVLTASTDIGGITSVTYTPGAAGALTINATGAGGITLTTITQTIP